MKKFHPSFLKQVCTQKSVFLSLAFCCVLFLIDTQAQPFSQNITVNSNQTAAITIQMWAGGGGGGSGSGSEGGGGGGGFSVFTYNVGPGSYSITGNAGGGGVAGSPGGNSTYTITGPGLNTTVTVFGGGAGSNSGGTGGLGGPGGNAGGDGGAPGSNTGGGGGGSGAGATPGSNGISGSGGAGGVTGGGNGGNSNSSGQSATGPGGGGGGKGNGGGNTSGSGGNGLILVDVVLPVDLIRFDAYPQDGRVELAWTTASELNNNYFQIEHSRNGIDFQAIGKMKGNGTTSETVAYQFLHRNPVAGTNYYRLKQMDFDGAFEYSNIISAQLQHRNGGIQIYPNPTTNRVVVTIADRPEILKFTFSNLLGQNIDLHPTRTDTGLELDLSSLATGIYILQMEIHGKTVTKRIVKE